MSDLREQIYPTTDDKLFLEYHGNSPWAQEMVRRGLRLNPEALAYMRREVDERARAKAEYESRLKEEQNAERKAAGLPPIAESERPAGAADPRGQSGDTAED